MLLRGQFDDLLHFFEVEVETFSATLAIKVRVIFDRFVKSVGAVGDDNLFDFSGFRKLIKISVNCSQTYRRKLLLHSAVNRFGGRVVARV